ncbi:hypothetical protein GQ54DRAFT_259727 [Martensiomyces pterosporus]|nr:hypothetical protein GQ54DRAFT_259727 [Martensiomyces pterosporus]
MVFTAPDYFPFLTRQFHRETQWDESNSYATFCRTSQAILDFAIPYGVSVSTGRGISNSLYSQLVFSMMPSRASSIGYLATSRALPAAQRPQQTHATSDAAAGCAPSKLGDRSTLTESSQGEMAAHALNDTAESNTEALLAGFLRSPETPLSNSETIALDLQYSHDLLQSIRAGTWKCNWAAGKPKRSTGIAGGPGSGYVGDYLLVAQMYPSVGSVTGSYISRRSEASELLVSGVSVAGPQPDFQLVLQHAINNRRWSSEVTLGTNGRLIGLRGQYNFGDISTLDSAAHAYYCGSTEEARRVLREKAHGRFSVGTELYYGVQDSSGGISVGARYRHDLPLFSDLTCVLNPIMGHLSLAWAQELRPRLCAAARYDFNMFSLNSDLAIGMEWQLDQNSVVKARWSGSQGLRCLVDARLNNMVFSMGLAFNKDASMQQDRIGGAKPSSQPPPNSGAGGGVTRLIKSFGLQFQWFL